MSVPIDPPELILLFCRLELRAAILQAMGTSAWDDSSTESLLRATASTRGATALAYNSGGTSPTYIPLASRRPAISSLYQAVPAQKKSTLWDTTSQRTNSLLATGFKETATTTAPPTSASRLATTSQRTVSSGAITSERLATQLPALQQAVSRPDGAVSQKAASSLTTTRTVSRRTTNRTATTTVPPALRTVTTLPVPRRTTAPKTGSRTGATSPTSGIRPSSNGRQLDLDDLPIQVHKKALYICILGAYDARIFTDSIESMTN